MWLLTVTDEELIEFVQRSFVHAVRPEQFTNRSHCDECREHDDTMRARTPASLELADIDNAGWNPVHFLQPDAFRYFLPGLIRVALTSDDQNSRPESSGVLWDLVTFHLHPGPGWSDWRFAALTTAETAAVVALYEHVAKTRQATILAEHDSERFHKMRSYWLDRLHRLQSGAS